jgi:hypothetical protein
MKTFVELTQAEREVFFPLHILAGSAATGGHVPGGHIPQSTKRQLKRY